ncbi:MAG: hypothetical protein J7J87_03380 [Candidatus Diapherotrites archaeon]|nr:hypothetical protein [Candidatus Diapherotrites archaeon]
MAIKPRKSPPKKIRKALLRGERFREKGRIAQRIDATKLEKIIRREASRKTTFRKKYGTQKYFIALAIAGLVEIIRSLRLPKTRKNRILKLETEQLKITDYLGELKQKGSKRLSPEEHAHIIELYCGLLKRKINRLWGANEVRRRQLINELKEYEAYLKNIGDKEYELSGPDRKFLLDLVGLINEETNYLLEHEQKYYAEARRKLSEILERIYERGSY